MATTTPPITAPGIASGLDVNSLIDQLVAVDKQPLVNLQQQEASYQAQLSAFGTLQGSLGTLQSAMQNLSAVSSFQKVSADVGDTTLLTASATSNVAAGTHTVDVQQLAQAQHLRSTTFTDSTTPVGTGSLTFEFGTYDSGNNTFTLNPDQSAHTITITPGSDTLSGIRDAVNAADIGVSASIINDGSGDVLVFSSQNSGTANSLKVTVTDDDGTNTDDAGLSQLAYDPTAAAGSGRNLSEIVAAQNASVVIDGIAVSKSSNTISDALEGVTLNLLKAGAGPTTLTIATDTDAIQAATQKFVDAYNGFTTTLKNLTAYDADTKVAAPLQGDSTTLSIERSVRSVLSLSVAYAPGKTAALPDIGITLQDDGTLAVDNTKLQQVIQDQPDLIGKLFAQAGTATDDLVNYSAAGANTQPGTYAVQLTQTASQGRLSGSAAAGLTITSGSNDSLDLTIDGIRANVTIGAGTYASADALAAELQSRINGNSAFADNGIGVTVTASTGVLSITSNRFGSASKVGIGAGAAADNLFGATPAAVAGVDVAGTIDGLPASGSGRTLIGASGSAVDGLKLDIVGGTTGNRGTITVSQGYASRLQSLIDGFLGDDGMLASRTDGINVTIKDLQQQEQAVNDQADAAEQRYRAQFTALDQLMSSLNSTSTFLQQQLANLPKITGSSSK
ncbi:MAG TPA: flagellar filament capping protein FliD [Burkholderiales bacterium]|jgi:flagellar hook-associated protein 2|nr:flagellar filament capping protein FliD [Burkholderiales bacterium]